MPFKLARAKTARIEEPHGQLAWLAMFKNQAIKQNISTTGHEKLDILLKLPKAPLKDKFMASKIWISDAPTECQLCETPITTTFVDGVVAGAGWANMCERCHRARGTGFGTGRGQLYRKDGNGDFVKVQG